MQYVSKYHSPLGEITLAADEVGLIGLWFEGQKHFGKCLSSQVETQRLVSHSRNPMIPCGEETQYIAPLQVIVDTKQWLDVYFSEEEPEFSVPLHLIGTEFQKQVWEILRTIPYGKTLTYKEIAQRIVASRGGEVSNFTSEDAASLIFASQSKRMSAQAVGNAVGRNNISIIIPCHRVIGTNGSLTGYAGGLERKRALLELETRL